MYYTAKHEIEFITCRFIILISSSLSYKQIFLKLVILGVVLMLAS